MRRRFAALVAGITACAACGAELASQDDFVDLPQRRDGDGSTDSTLGDSSSSSRSDSPASSDAASGGDVADGAVKPCEAIDGSTVYCIGRSQPFTTNGTITYGTGFTGKLPAMGLGRPGVGYIPVDVPFTCAAAVGARGVPPPNNTAGGKICEVSFDNTNSAVAVGTATYTIESYADAAAGTYHFGLSSNPGTTITEQSFYLRIVP